MTASTSFPLSSYVASATSHALVTKRIHRLGIRSLMRNGLKEVPLQKISRILWKSLYFFVTGHIKKIVGFCRDRSTSAIARARHKLLYWLLARASEHHPSYYGHSASLHSHDTTSRWVILKFSAANFSKLQNQRGHWTRAFLITIRNFNSDLDVAS